MIQTPPEGYDKYVAFIKTDAMPFKHKVVDISTTPPDILEKLRNYDRQHFEYDGEHSIEFIGD